MAKTYYLPTDDTSKLAWLINFNNKLSGYATLFGLVVADTTSVANDAAMFKYSLDLVENFNAEKKERTTFKNLMRDGADTTTTATLPTVPTPPTAPTMVTPGIFPRVTKLVAHLKVHPAYNEAIGKDLGIEGSESSAAKAALKPQITYEFKAGQPVLKTKKGNAKPLTTMWTGKTPKASCF